MVKPESAAPILIEQMLLLFQNTGQFVSTSDSKCLTRKGVAEPCAVDSSSLARKQNTQQTAIRQWKRESTRGMYLHCQCRIPEVGSSDLPSITHLITFSDKV